MTGVPRTKNLELISLVAGRLQDLVENVVFLGGCSTALLITDDEIVTVRPTLDVDVIIEVMTRPDYHKLEKRLRKLGFEHDKNGPRCRFHIDGIVVDVMPDDEEILGFTNIWYKAAIETSENRVLGDIQIRVISPPLFLATKLEAHYGRSAGDYMGSHDMEDILAVVDGRPSIIQDCFGAPDDVKYYLSEKFGELLEDDAFVDLLPGFVDRSGGAGRAEILKVRLQNLVKTLA